MATFGEIPLWLATMLERQLVEAGFRPAGKIAHRVTNRKVDVLGVVLIRKALCLKWRLPYGSFTIEPACFLPFVPSLELAGFGCCRYANTKLPSYLGCFKRLYLTGFTALELGEWALAESSLEQCYETAISKSLDLRPEILQCVKCASSLASRHLLLPHN
jgi:hypothetical protein